MRRKLSQRCMLILLSIYGLMGCSNPTETLLESENQVKLRSIQSRRFDTNDKIKAIRVAMATMQDLGFVIDKADSVLGTVSGTKLDNYSLRMTVTVRPSGENQMIVRASAQYNLKAVEDPIPYQNFFTAYEKAMFLTAHQVE